MGQRHAGWGAGVPQVVVVDLPLGGAHHHPRPVRGEVHRRQRSVRTDHTQDAGTHTQVTHTKLHTWPLIKIIFIVDESKDNLFE